MYRYLVRSAVVLAGVAFVACRLQDFTPGSTRHEEGTLQAATTLFYHALGQRDTTELDQAALPAATALVGGPGDAAVLVPIRTMVTVSERRNENGGVRVVRSELHPDGDIATTHVVVVARSRDGSQEFEASDWLTFARRGEGWRVAHAVFGPWRNRTAP